MKVNNRYYNIKKEGQHSLMNYLKSVLFVAVLTIVALNVHASHNNILKSDTTEIDTFQSSEEAEMELEAWMLDVELFRHFITDRKNGYKPCKYIAKTDEEKELPLETWMLDKLLFYKKFKNKKFEKTSIAEWDRLK